MDGDQLDIEDAVKARPQEFLDGKVALFKGDCLSILASLPENSIDAVVCDPPYHLTSIVKRFGKTNVDGEGTNEKRAKAGADGMARLSRGFMGKTWDGGDIAFRAETWALVLRVLKPGGHLIAFSGTRTYHRMACAIEDAGFEVRDMIAWHYGCLDTETQAVTPSGLRSHDALKVGDLVLSYDSTTKSYQWGAVEEVYAYDIDDTVYRISTDHGEQVVSRNHRCLVERGGNETFEFAEDVARQREANIPILESLPALLDALCVQHEGSGHSKQSVQSGVQEIANRESQFWRRVSGAPQGQVRGNLRSMRSRVLAQHEVAGAHQTPGLLRAMQRALSRSRLAGARTQRARGMEAGIGGVARRAHDWIVESFVEGWRHLSQAPGKLRLSALCPVPAGVPADGTHGWLRDGASTGGCSHSGSVLNQGRGGASHRPSTFEQRGYKPDAVRNEQGSQTVRSWPGHKAVVGRITPERYRGVVWCIRVRTGAFVAVRNGMAFPTGNSGFPKSHNVSKAMDARSKLGSARTEDMRRLSMGDDYVPSGRGRKNYDNGGGSQMNGAADYTPEGDAAKQWDGWGTALKPSHEPVCFAQKPLTNKQLFATIGSDAARLWSRLWLMLSAKDAVKYLGLNPNALGVETSAFAQWTAADASSTRAALSAQMGTSQFGSALISALSTVSSWNSTLAEASGHASTFITGTESSTTTELKILKSSLSRITPESIILAHKLGGWSNASASPAEKTFNAHVRKWQSTLELHALASVTEQFAEPSQVETATGSERVVLARKPLDGTVAENVMKWGVGALNIDACRVNTEDNLNGGAYVAVGGRDVSNSLHAGTGMNVAGKTTGKQFEQPVGRWPANLMHDGSPEVVAMFPAETGVSSGGKGEASQKSALAGHVYGEYSGATLGANAGGLGDSGSAARFFWSSKAAADDRLGSKHPTVKPLDLMRELTRLVTPPGGVVLDPFAGTGTTGEAAYLEGFRSVLIEMEVEYQADIARRMHLVTQPDRRAAVAKTKNNTEMPVEGLPLFGGDRTKAGA